MKQEPIPDNEQFERLRDIILPVLAEAAIGHFDHDVPLSPEGSHEFNKMLMGVQIMLEVIRQQQRELEQAETTVADVQYQTSEILARMLDRSGSGRFYG